MPQSSVEEKVTTWPLLLWPREESALSSLYLSPLCSWQASDDLGGLAGRLTAIPLP